jgi:hypothetical protein
MDNSKQLIYDGKLDEAIHLLDIHIAKHPADDNAWYQRGNAYRESKLSAGVE